MLICPPARLAIWGLTSIAKRSRCGPSTISSRRLNRRAASLEDILAREWTGIIVGLSLDHRRSEVLVSYPIASMAETLASVIGK